MMSKFKKERTEPSNQNNSTINKKYKTLELIGKGSFSHVYKAENLIDKKM